MRAIATASECVSAIGLRPSHLPVVSLTPDPRAVAQFEKATTVAKLAAARKRKPSLRQISAALAAAGHLNELGKPFAPKSIAAMLAT